MSSRMGGAGLLVTGVGIAAAVVFVMAADIFGLIGLVAIIGGVAVGGMAAARIAGRS